MVYAIVVKQNMAFAVPKQAKISVFFDTNWRHKLIYFSRLKAWAMAFEKLKHLRTVKARTMYFPMKKQILAQLQNKALQIDVAIREEETFLEK